MKHFISCIIPFYNTATFLDSCIQSCINQTYKNFEVILVNDASNDNSLEIAKSYLKYPQVTLINLKTNVGPGTARNIAIEWILSNNFDRYNRGGGYRDLSMLKQTLYSYLY